MAETSLGPAVPRTRRETDRRDRHGLVGRSLTRLQAVRPLVIIPNAGPRFTFAPSFRAA